MLHKTIICGLSVAALMIAATSIDVRDTRLADAAQRGDRDTVQALLKQKTDVNLAQGDGTTALHWAAFRDDVAMARMLLAAGANVKAETRMAAVTPLFMASRNGSAAMIEVLLKAGADANHADGTGATPLMIAAASGSTDAIKLLLDHGANANATENAHGQTALMFAAALNRDTAVKLLIARGANPEAATKVYDPGCGSVFNRNECDATDQYGNPVTPKDAKPGSGAVATKAPAEEALTPAQTEKVKQEKENAQRRRSGARVMGGMTALLFAARDGQMDAARALVDAGADINDQGAGEKMTPMVMAIASGHYDLGKYFLDHGADPNRASAAGLTALYATIDMQWAPYAWLPQPVTFRESVNYLDLMKALLDHGANPNARIKEKIWFRSLSGDHGWVDPGGATPFWRAAEATDLKAMHMLVEAGADPKIPSTAGATPLMVAAGLGWAANFARTAPSSWMEAVKYCLELGNDVNARDDKDYTALHGAAFRGDTEMVKFLVEKGARVDIVTKEGFSAADMANGPIEHSEQHPATVELLQKLGSPFANNCRSTNCFIVDGKERKKLGQ